MAAPKTNRRKSEGVPAPLTDNVPAKSSLPSDASPSNPDVLRTLYSVMLKTRLLEEQVLALLRAGRIPGVPVPILGGEATEVGVCIGLQPDDSFSTTQPKLATHVISDTPLKQVFAQLFNIEKEYLAAHPSSASAFSESRSADCNPCRPAQYRHRTRARFAATREVQRSRRAGRRRSRRPRFLARSRQHGRAAAPADRFYCGELRASPHQRNRAQ